MHQALTLANWGLTMFLFHSGKKRTIDNFYLFAHIILLLFVKWSGKNQSLEKYAFFDSLNWPFLLTWKKRQNYLLEQWNLDNDTNSTRNVEASKSGSTVNCGYRGLVSIKSINGGEYILIRLTIFIFILHLVAKVGFRTFGNCIYQNRNSTNLKKIISSIIFHHTTSTFNILTCRVLLLCMKTFWTEYRKENEPMVSVHVCVCENVYCLSPFQ